MTALRKASAPVTAVICGLACLLASLIPADFPIWLVRALHDTGAVFLTSGLTGLALTAMFPSSRRNRPPSRQPKPNRKEHQ